MDFSNTALIIGIVAAGSLLYCHHRSHYQAPGIFYGAGSSSMKDDFVFIFTKPLMMHVLLIPPDVCVVFKSNRLLQPSDTHHTQCLH